MKRFLAITLIGLCLLKQAAACSLVHRAGAPIDHASAVKQLNQSLYSAAEKNFAEPFDGEATVAQIDCYLDSLAPHYPVIASFRASLARAGKALHTSQVGVQQSMAIEALNASVNRDAGTAYVVFPNINAGRTEISLLDDLITKNCSTVASDACAEALSAAQNLWWIAGQYRAFADQYNKTAKQRSLAFNQALDSQWRWYKDDTVLLWPHEVAVNSLFYKRAERGLSAPPSYKLLWLRPALGLSYLSDQSHRVQPSINIDLFGIYWWRYHENGISPGRGVSASLIWDGDDSAYGLTYHHNPKWSLSVAQGDDNDLVLSVSFQLAYWLLKQDR